MLILDTRTSDLFDKQRLADSINLSPESIENFLETSQDGSEVKKLSILNLAQMLPMDEAFMFSERKRRFCILVISHEKLSPDFISEAKALSHASENDDCFEINEANFSDQLKAAFRSIYEDSSVSTGIEIFRLLRKERIQELHILVDGAADFFQKYPYMEEPYPCNPSENPQTPDLNSPTKPRKVSDLPHDIFGGRLFLGSFNQAKQLELIKKVKITHIVNAAYECCNEHEDKDIKYLKLWLRDESEDKVSQHFDDVYNFMHEAIIGSENNVVLVHCALGKSRSASLVIMYLMKRFSWPFDMAFHYVKSRRTIISPYYGFIKELEEFEKKGFQFELNSAQ